MCNWVEDIKPGSSVHSSLLHNFCHLLPPPCPHFQVQMWNFQAQVHLSAAHWLEQLKFQVTLDLAQVLKSVGHLCWVQPMRRVFQDSCWDRLAVSDLWELEFLSPSELPPPGCAWLRCGMQACLGFGKAHGIGNNCLCCWRNLASLLSACIIMAVSLVEKCTGRESLQNDIMALWK